MRVQAVASGAAPSQAGPAAGHGAVLVCAATSWEAGPLARGLRLGSFGLRLSDGVVTGKRVILLRTGMGAPRASASLEGLRDLPRLACGLSAGLAGALDPRLKAGDLVVDLGGSERRWEAAALKAAQRCGLPLRFGRVVTAASVLGPAEKAALAASTGAAAVDMETEALRSWSAGRGLPVLAARVILDEAAETAPAAFPDPDDRWALAAGVLARPLALPSLLVTGWRARQGLKALALFLEEFLPLL
ncbi:MAG: hypothetical protein HY924_14180 [Elusimicrobia bacterium]|nr:hypothetical protein [Elusimicrobiota bacterium]